MTTASNASKLTADAKAAGCTFQSFPSEGRTHTASKVTYKTNPPTSGNHNPTPAQDGFYQQGNSPPKENFVHSLEHGRIEFQYKPGTSAADIAKLRALAAEPLNGSAGYHVLFFENDTKMPARLRRRGMDEVAHLSAAHGAVARRDARVSQGLHGQGPRVHSVIARGERCGRKAAGLCAYAAKKPSRRLARCRGSTTRTLSRRLPERLD